MMSNIPYFTKRTIVRLPITKGPAFYYTLTERPHKLWSVTERPHNFFFLLSPKDPYGWGAWWHLYVTLIYECPWGFSLQFSNVHEKTKCKFILNVSAYFFSTTWKLFLYLIQWLGYETYQQNYTVGVKNQVHLFTVACKHCHMTLNELNARMTYLILLSVYAIAHNFSCMPPTSIK